MSQSALIKSILWALHIFTVRVIARWVLLREEAAVASFFVAAHHVIAGRGATNSAGRVPNHRSEVTNDSCALGWILVVVILFFIVPGGGAINSVLPSRVCRCEEVFPLPECLELGVVFQTQSITAFAVKLSGIVECIQVEAMVIGELS